MVLKNPVWSSLGTGHENLGSHSEFARRYDPKISPFAALRENTAECLLALAEITPLDDVVALFPEVELSGPWQLLNTLQVVQLVCEREIAPSETQFDLLLKEHAEDMLELAQLTEPGPFAIQTGRMGRFVGLWDADQLVAMVGERLKPSGYIEVSGVCTRPDYRGRGIAAALVQNASHHIQQQGLIPFLHVAVNSASESTALGVYERLGYAKREEFALSVLKRV